MWCFVCQSAVFCINAQRTPVVGMSELGDLLVRDSSWKGLFRGAQKVQQQPGEGRHWADSSSHFAPCMGSLSGAALSSW